MPYVHSLEEVDPFGVLVLASYHYSRKTYKTQNDGMEDVARQVSTEDLAMSEEKKQQMKYSQSCNGLYLAYLFPWSL